VNRLGLFLTTAIVLLIAACGGKTGAPPTGGLAAPARESDDPQARWAKTLDAAKQEGKVVVVTHTNLYYQKEIEKFGEKYPDIPVEQVSMRPSEFTPKVITEQQNGIYGYDVWVSPTSNMVETVVPAGGFESLIPYLILPEVTDSTQYRGGKPLYVSSEPYVMAYQGNVTTNVWVNRDLLPASEFNTLDQLVDPKLKGKIAIRTPSAPHAGSLTLTGLLHNKGQAFLDQLLIDQQPVFIDNARLMTQDLINGKYPVAIGIDGETMDACQREGGCKSMQQLTGYEYMLSYGVGILKNPPHPNAAAVFLNWFLSKEGQQAFVQSVEATTPPPYDQAQSIRVDVDPNPDAIKDQAMPDYDHLEKYSLQGMEAGRPEMQAVLAAYKKVEESGGR